MRALQARLILCRQRGQLGEAEEAGTQSPLRKFKSMFPNTRIDKHTPLDILILAPEKNQPRTMIVRDLGSLQNDWIAQEFVLAYFEGKGLSPPVRCVHVDQAPYTDESRLDEGICRRRVAEVWELRQGQWSHRLGRKPLGVVHVFQPLLFCFEAQSRLYSGPKDYE